MHMTFTFNAARSYTKFGSVRAPLTTHKYLHWIFAHNPFPLPLMSPEAAANLLEHRWLQMYPCTPSLPATVLCTGGSVSIQHCCCPQEVAKLTAIYQLCLQPITDSGPAGFHAGGACSADRKGGKSQGKSGCIAWGLGSWWGYGTHWKVRGLLLALRQRGTYYLNSLHTQRLSVLMGVCSKECLERGRARSSHYLL